MRLSNANMRPQLKRWSICGSFRGSIRGLYQAIVRRLSVNCIHTNLRIMRLRKLVEKDTDNPQYYPHLYPRTFADYAIAQSWSRMTPIIRSIIHICIHAHLLIMLSRKAGPEWHTYIHMYPQNSITCVHILFCKFVCAPLMHRGLVVGLCT